MVPIELKPLRERREDIPYLTEQFCRGFNKKYGKNAQISSEGMELILAYNWPGNIRELENLVERIVVTSSGGLVTRGSVYNALNPGGRSPAGRPEEDLPLRQQVAAYEREIILHTLERTGSMRKAAKVLGVDHSTLVKKCRQYGQADPAQ